MDVLTRIITIALALIFTATFPTKALSTQERDRQAPELMIGSLAGRDLFEFYCASCHGRDGKGHGRVASALKTPPPDLTLLIARNRGTFPAERVEEVIRGGKRESIPAHGSSDMPVWGPIFKALDNRNSVNEERIDNLIKYIESIQAKAKAERRDMRDVSPAARVSR